MLQSARFIAAIARIPAAGAGAGAGMSLSEGGVKMSAVERGAGMSPAEGGPVVRIERRERDGPVGRRGKMDASKCNRARRQSRNTTRLAQAKPAPPSA